MESARLPAIFLVGYMIKSGFLRKMIGRRSRRKAHIVRKSLSDVSPVHQIEVTPAKFDKEKKKESYISSSAVAPTDSLLKKVKDYIHPCLTYWFSVFLIVHFAATISSLVITTLSSLIGTNIWGNCGSRFPSKVQRSSPLASSKVRLFKNWNKN